MYNFSTPFGFSVFCSLRQPTCAQGYLKTSLCKYTYVCKYVGRIGFNYILLIFHCPIDIFKFRLHIWTKNLIEIELHFALRFLILLNYYQFGSAPH